MSIQLYRRLEELINFYGRAEGLCLTDILCDNHDPNAIAFRFIRGSEAHDLSYGELRQRAERLAAAMVAHGLGPGARIATLMGKSRELLVTLMAIWRLGAVHVPLFTAFAPEGIALRLAGSAADAVFCDAGQRAKLDTHTLGVAGKRVLLVTLGEGEPGDPAIPWHVLAASDAPCPPPHISLPDDPVICIFTSGTTGRAKGVDLPVKGLASLHAYAEFGLGIVPEDIFWCAADPGWAYGLYYAVVAPMLLGHRNLLLEGGFDADNMIAVLEREKVTNFAAAPTVYRALRANGKVQPDRLSLKKLSSAGEPLTADLNEWAPSVLGAQILDHYGQTEAGMIVNNHHHPALCEKPIAGSMGVAMPGWKVQIVDEGTLSPLGPEETGILVVDLPGSPLAWFDGYIGDKEKSAAKFSSDGCFYYTGDTARIDAAGRVFFSARADDVILMAGYRIGPFEIESTLNEHPLVQNSAAIGVADELRGERLEAFVVLVDGAEGSDNLAGELQSWVKLRYAAHAYPRAIHFTRELPMTPSGKIQRNILRQSLSQ